MLRSSHYASLHLVLALGVSARFFLQAFTQSSLAAPLAPKPSKVSLRSIVLNWGQSPLIVRLACGSRGCRAVTVFACYVTFLLLPPLLIGVAVFASFVTSLRSTATYCQPKRELAFHSLHSVTLIPLRSIKLHFIHSFRQALLLTPQKETSLHAKTSPSLLRQPPHSLRYAPLRAPCLPPSLSSQRLRLSLRQQEKHSTAFRCFSTASVQLKAVFPALFSAVSAPNPKSAYDKVLIYFTLEQKMLKIKNKNH